MIDDSQKKRYKKHNKQTKVFKVVGGALGTIMEERVALQKFDSSKITFFNRESNFQKSVLIASESPD